jgi:ABC-type nitrate/sulfonate/bicarbonate transport system substrate-binding protein
MAHTIYASADQLKRNPDTVRRFLAGWFEAVAYMRAHPDETIRIDMPVTGLTEADEQTEYKLLMPGISANGRFDPKDLERIGQSFVELHVLDQTPDMAKLYTEQYLPPK